MHVTRHRAEAGMRDRVPEGTFTKFLPPLSAGNRIAILIWNRLGGELRWPDLAYELVLSDDDDMELMLARLRALRERLKKA